MTQFQYRKRYEVTCDDNHPVYDALIELRKFQYRKRYEVTCDLKMLRQYIRCSLFQYRKRYEVTCDSYGSYTSS